MEQWVGGWHRAICTPWSPLGPGLGAPLSGTWLPASALRFGPGMLWTGAIPKQAAGAADSLPASSPRRTPALPVARADPRRGGSLLLLRRSSLFCPPPPCLNWRGAKSCESKRFRAKKRRARSLQAFFHSLKRLLAPKRACWKTETTLIKAFKAPQKCSLFAQGSAPRLRSRFRSQPLPAAAPGGAHPGAKFPFTPFIFYGVEQPGAAARPGPARRLSLAAGLLPPRSPATLTPIPPRPEALCQRAQPPPASPGWSVWLKGDASTGVGGLLPVPKASLPLVHPDPRCHEMSGETEPFPLPAASLPANCSGPSLTRHSKRILDSIPIQRGNYTHS